MKTNLLTYLLTYLRNNNKIKQEGHTTLIIYDKNDWKKFRHILDFEGTNPNRLFWCVVGIVLEQFDQKEHSLDKFLSEIELLIPTIESDPEKTLEYMRTKSIDEVKKLEEIFSRNLIYAKAITQGEVDFRNYVYLWRKYR